MSSVMISFDFEAAPGSVSERFGEITTKWRWHASCFLCLPFQLQVRSASWFDMKSGLSVNRIQHIYIYFFNTDFERLVLDLCCNGCAFALILYLFPHSMLHFNDEVRWHWGLRQPFTKLGSGTLCTQGRQFRMQVQAALPRAFTWPWHARGHWKMLSVLRWQRFKQLFRRDLTVVLSCILLMMWSWKWNPQKRPQSGKRS